MVDFLEAVIGFNWATYTHQKLYDMVTTEAEGMRAVDDADAEIAEFRALMRESADDVEQALAEAGVSWQGLAADSMGSGVSPLAQWANDAGTAGQATGDGHRQAGDSFGYVATAMPEPVPTPSKTMSYPPMPEDLVMAQTDQDGAERAAQQAKLRAVELMDGYLDNSLSGMSSLGEFVPPQDFTVGTPADTGGSAGSEVGVFEGPDTGGGPVAGDDGPGPGGSGGRDGGPYGGSDPSGGSVGSVERPAGTDAARAAPPAAAPLAPVGDSSRNVPGTSPPGTFTPVAGPTPRPGPGGGPARGGGSGAGRGAGGVSGGGRGPGGAPGVAGRGGLSGAGPPAGEPAAGARGGHAPAGRAGTGPAGFGPMGAGRRDEDQERTSPEYLRDHRDDFWDDTPAVAPPVIGLDDD